MHVMSNTFLSHSHILTGEKTLVVQICKMHLRYVKVALLATESIV